jgi:hypothetical protein
VSPWPLCMQGQRTTTTVKFLLPPRQKRKNCLRIKQFNSDTVSALITTDNFPFYSAEGVRKRPGGRLACSSMIAEGPVRPFGNKRNYPISDLTLLFGLDLRVHGEGKDFPSRFF